MGEKYLYGKPPNDKAKTDQKKIVQRKKLCPNKYFGGEKSAPKNISSSKKIPAEKCVIKDSVWFINSNNLHNML